MQAKQHPLRLKDRYVGYAFLLPALLFMLVFVIYPIFYNIMVSLQDVTVTTLLQKHRDFIGLDNYKAIWQGKYLKNALGNTLIYTVGCIVLQFTLGFFLAIIYTQKAKRLKPLSGVLLVTYIMPATIVAIVFKFFFQSSGGFINSLLKGWGLITNNIEWLVQGDLAKLSVILANTWTGVAFNMILLTAGLVNIPQEVYESATIDGAGSFQEFRYITLPMMRGTMATVLVLGFVYTFKCFELIYVMTGGGPLQATELLTIYAYRRSFTEYAFGEGAAIANVLFLCLLIVGSFYTKLLNSQEEW